MTISRLYPRGLNALLWDNGRNTCGFRALNGLRAYSAPTPENGFKNTSPSSSKPLISLRRDVKSDEGHLAFTKASLYKLTLPLAHPSDDSTSPASEPSSESVQQYSSDKSLSFPNDPVDNDAETWEQQVESGNLKEPLYQSRTNNVDEESSGKGPHSVIFLLHSGQPLSYIANLIRAEVPEAVPASVSEPERDKRSSNTRARDSTGNPPITFHTSVCSGKRWSPSTGIGDFLREAARVGSFTISIGVRRVRVFVPSFDERTRFLRASLHAKTRQIERFAHIKCECDHIAREATQKVAFAGAGIMGVWWVTIGVLTFNTDLGWDTMEPITYLTGLGTVISGYLWFLWHNREVSYRTVLTESTSRRQHKLYAERGFDVEAYHELIDEAKALRRAIKHVAWDYELEWNQGNTETGKGSQKALEIVRRDEMRERNGKRGGDDKYDDALAQVDDDGDGRPDRKP